MKKTAQILFIFISINCFNSCNSGNKSNTKINEELQKIQPNDEIVTDINGNKYKTIKIGNNIWFASNLKATKFSNGDPIPNLLKDSEWKKTNGPAYCLFNNSIDNLEYGCLYNLAAIIDKRNVCPQGWHLPTKEETIWNNQFNTKKILNHRFFNNKVLGWRRVYDDVDEKDEFSTFWLETEFEDGGGCHYWLGDSYMDDNYDTEDPDDKILRGYEMESNSGGEYYWGNKYDGFPCRCVKDSIKN
jgi:uncharacterized protein (TIGR02145 family)